MESKSAVKVLQDKMQSYRQMTDSYEAIEDFQEIEKLGQDFTLTDLLEEVDIGDSDRKD